MLEDIFLPPNSSSTPPSLTNWIKRLGEQDSTQQSPVPTASQHNQAIV